MRVLVTGINGQLGHDVCKILNNKGHEVIGAGRESIDLENLDSIDSYIKKINPQGIIHCAAYTNVEGAEIHKHTCRKINSLAVRQIAISSRKLDIPIIYISTDYVFDGKKNGEYYESDIPNPINVYGESKLEGEKFIQELSKKYFIVRTSWVFGQNGNNFVNTMLNLSKKTKKLSVVSDQIGSPTYTKDLANVLVDMIESDEYGIYHVTNEGFCSWAEFAKTIFESANIKIKITSISSEEYETKARRPMNSRMSKSKLEQNGFLRLRTWEEAVKEYIQNLNI